MTGSVKKLESLRMQMLSSGIDAYILPVTDPHLGEYVPAHWRLIQWLTGFTGSAANVVVTKDFAGLWTDSRYFIQAAEQLDGSNFRLMKLRIPHTPEYIDWIVQNIPSGGVVAFDGRTMPVGTMRAMEKSFSRISIRIDHTVDLLGPLWTDRPSMPATTLFEHPLKYTGSPRSEKIAAVRSGMSGIGVDFHLLTSLDDIAWLLNLRGNDVSYSPLFTSYFIIGMESMFLFGNEKRIPGGIRQSLEDDGINILPYEETALILSSLPVGSSILITPATTSVNLCHSIGEGIEVLEEVSIPTRLKAVRNDTEILNTLETMVSDGVAMTKFFYWLEMNLGKMKISEISAAEKLLGFRLENPNCLGPSFETISAYNAHGASPHYSSTPLSDVRLGKEGIYLLDSGGQYWGGTTDITRTISLGEPTQRQKTDFTLALKGTIALASVKFPHGTRGYQVEVLARKALWDNGLNYGHGTGHGVGYFLNVHEGPQTIGTGASGDLRTVIEPGMVTADEPAIYREGEYGFRTENLILCTMDELTEYGQFLRFETITLCYIDTTLLDTSIMTDDELKWLNSYHERVFDKLSPELDREHRDWLRKKTLPVTRTEN